MPGLMVKKASPQRYGGSLITLLELADCDGIDKFKILQIWPFLERFGMVTCSEEARANL